MTPAPCAKSVRLLRVFLVLRFSSARPREVTQVWPAFAVPPFHDSIFWGASRSPPPVTDVAPAIRGALCSAPVRAGAIAHDAATFGVTFVATIALGALWVRVS